MKNQDIYSKKNNILSAINSGRLATAFKLLRSFSEQQMSWEITDEINRLEESYRYMLDYAIRGIHDPSRQNVYDSIVASMIQLLNRLERNALSKDSPTLYYNTLRYIKQSFSDSVTSLLKKYDILNNDYWNTGAHLTPDCSASIENRRKREVVERDMFNLLWTDMPLTSEDYESLRSALESDKYFDRFKQFIISAILLGMLEFYDSRRLLLLLDAYEKGNNNIAPVAIIALLLSLYMYRDRTPDSRVSARLKLMADNPNWHNDLRDAFLELVRARDTERITRTMQEEVVPEMLKLRPEIRKRFGNIDNIPTDPADLDINPEWQEMLEKSGIADKMKKLFEIQLEGGDVFMSTFAHLKSFPFFNDISNWFMPFHSDRSEVTQVPEALADIVRVLETTPVFCNSDKFSFVLSLQNIPDSQRELLKSQFSSQVDGLLEIQKASLETTAKNRAGVMNRYVQDLYRFFKLFRRKCEFNDPFILDLNLVNVPAISSELNDIESLQAIAEFYFKHRYYSDALSLFKVIESLSRPDIQLFEKMGYCYEKEHDYRQALKYYEQAELLNADSLWTLRHIALCHRMNGNYREALTYYKRVVEKEPDESIATAMAIGNCYLEMGRFDEATKYYYKVNYLDSKAQRGRRQLAWCLMMQREFDKAKQIYDEILISGPSPDDYLNMGHLALALSDGNNAFNFYRLCISSGNLDIDKFAAKLNNDAEAFSLMGLDPGTIPLIVDAISYAGYKD